MDPTVVANTRIDYVISLAQAEIGTTEVSGQPNNVKYNTDYYGRVTVDGDKYDTKGDGYPWCVIFLWWIFKKAGLSDVLYTDNNGKVASVYYLTKYAQDNGQWVTSGYKKGDIISLKSSSHMGIVTSVGTSNIYTIEGNTTVSSTSEGVAAKTHVIASEIKGAYRPKYA